MKLIDNIDSWLEDKNRLELGHTIFIENGEINKANEMLGSNYFICGEVVKGKGLGNKLDFPTANILLKQDKFEIKKGVYITFVVLDNKIYLYRT